MIAPTVSGNELVAADEYAFLRDGLDTRVALPRLRLLVPAEAVTLLEQRQESLEFALYDALRERLPTTPHEERALGRRRS